MRNKTISKGLSLRSKTLILVDFDGTLVDTMDALWKCFQQFLNKYGVKATRTEFKKLIGPSISEIVSILKEEYQLKPSKSSLEKEYRSLVSQAYEHELKFFPFAFEALKALKEQKFKIAIVTASPKAMVAKILKKTQIDVFVDSIINLSPAMPAKPDPAIYLKALRKFRIKPDAAIAIEDSLNGCTSSIDAGIFTILLTHNEKTKSYGLKANEKTLLKLNGWKAVQKYLLGN